MPLRLKLRRVSDQTVVVTGASSGIGLATAKMAAQRGARVLLASRNEDALRKAVQEIGSSGGRAAYAVADVAQEGDVRHIAEEAVREFGGFDTWVNNAAVAVYGRTYEVPVEDQRRVFDVDYWGTVYGSRVAAEHLRDRGGAIINIGSVLSDMAIPLQGVYVAAKHAVKGFTDALRMELEEAGVPISVTLIKPTSIDTPYFEHAANYMDEAPKPPPPVYAPEVVARGILHCAEHPRRDLVIGGGGEGLSGDAQGCAAHHRLVHGTHDVCPAEVRQAQREPRGQPLRPAGRRPRARRIRRDGARNQFLHAGGDAPRRGRRDRAGRGGAGRLGPHVVPGPLAFWGWRRR